MLKINWFITWPICIYWFQEYNEVVKNTFQKNSQFIYFTSTNDVDDECYWGWSCSNLSVWQFFCVWQRILYPLGTYKPSNKFILILTHGHTHVLGFGIFATEAGDFGSCLHVHVRSEVDLGYIQFKMPDYLCHNVTTPSVLAEGTFSASIPSNTFVIRFSLLEQGYYKDTVEFYFPSRNECKVFWKKCLEHHAFFRCHTVKKLPRNKTRVVSRGSSFRWVSSFVALM